MKSVGKKKSGQTILFLFFVILIGMVVVIWNFNLHRGVVMKMRMRDAGDAAALTSARWQGITLNMVGELNLIQAAFVTETIANGLPYEDEYGNPFETITEAVEYEIGPQLDQIHALRLRIALNGPLVGFAAAQQLVLNNRIHANNAYQAQYRDYADVMVALSGQGSLGEDYGLLLSSIADNGVAARTIVTSDSHILLDPGFYDAIDAGMTHWWCLFANNAEYMQWLSSYSSSDDWPELPTDSGYSILDLNVRHTTSSIGAFFENQTNDLGSVEEFESVVENLNDKVDVNRIEDVVLRWATYGSSWHNSWQEFIEYKRLPFRRDILPQYDYMGPESVFEISSGFDETYRGFDGIDSRFEGASSRLDVIPDPDKKPGEEPRKTTIRGMRWISAAKAFGSLDQGGSAGQAWTPSHFGFVLPAFTDVRLIPVQRAVHNVETSPWHDGYHVPRLLEFGMSALDPNCSACRALMAFDNPSFRQRGEEWIEANRDICEQVGGGGGGGGGGGPVFGH